MPWLAAEPLEEATMPKYSLRDLQNIVAVAECGSVTLAADAVGLSQPAMSTALMRLERILSCTLMVRRKGHGVSLTPEGELFVAEARVLLERADELEARMSAAISDEAGQLVVGSLVTVAPIVVASLVRRFRAEYPQITVEIRTGSQDQLLEWLTNGALHLAITYDLELTPSIEFTRLVDAVPHVLLHAEHPLAQRETIELAELERDRYILLDLPLSREYFLSLFMAADVSPRPQSRHNDLAFVRTLVGNGFGYSLVNLLPATDVAQDGSRVAYIRLESPLRPLGLGLARRPDPRPPASLATFVRFTRDALMLPRQPTAGR